MAEWRVGRSQLRTIYRDDVLVGLMDSPEIAAEVVAALRASAAVSVINDPESIARAFHEAYERLAPSHGYETRKASAVPWEDVPANNRALMTAVASEVAPLIAAQVLRNVSDQIAHRYGELRDNYGAGRVSIDYINGMEDADGIVERAIAAVELPGRSLTEDVP